MFVVATMRDIGMANKDTKEVAYLRTVRHGKWETKI